MCTSTSLYKAGVAVKSLRNINKEVAYHTCFILFFLIPSQNLYPNSHFSSNFRNFLQFSRLLHVYLSLTILHVLEHLFFYKMKQQKRKYFIDKIKLIDNHNAGVAIKNVD